MTLGALPERRNPKTADIDRAGGLAIGDLINAEDRTVAEDYVADLGDAGVEAELNPL